jgi:hypothetical protein
MALLTTFADLRTLLFILLGMPFALGVNSKLKNVIFQIEKSSDNVHPLVQLDFVFEPDISFFN